MPKKSDHNLISLLFVMGRRMRDEMKEAQPVSGGSWLHFEALRYVKEYGKPAMMRDIAAHFSITPPAATLLVDGLVLNKLLRRIGDVKDRRAIRIAITPKGRRVLERGVRARVKKLQEVFSVLDAKEYATLVRILEKITKS